MDSSWSTTDRVLKRSVVHLRSGKFRLFVRFWSRVAWLCFQRWVWELQAFGEKPSASHPRDCFDFDNSHHRLLGSTVPCSVPTAIIAKNSLFFRHRTNTNCIFERSDGIWWAEFQTWYAPWTPMHYHSVNIEYPCTHFLKLRTRFLREP